MEELPAVVTEEEKIVSLDEEEADERKAVKSVLTKSEYSWEPESEFTPLFEFDCTRALEVKYGSVERGRVLELDGGNAEDKAELGLAHGIAGAKFALGSKMRAKFKSGGVESENVPY